MTQAVAIRLQSWNVAMGIRWFKRAAPAVLTVLIAAMLVQPPVAHSAGIPTKADPLLFSQAQAHPSEAFSVIVRESQPASPAAEDLVKSLGGHITHELSIVGGFSAVVPGSAVPALTQSPLVWRVWGDAHLHMLAMPGYGAAQAANTVWQHTINLDEERYTGINGSGVGVALLDTGVVPVPDLVNHISHVVDLTPEDNGLDTFGHGTHMAGIIAGDGASSNGTWTGVAPGANIVSVKVAGANGATDVSVVMAGLQWIVTHKAQYGIRVLNLSFGTDSKQSYSIDPLDYAVEQAWRSGIVAVVSAGNTGGSGTVTKPGDDPYVITVGAADLKNTNTRLDDNTASFSSYGPTQDGFAKPDVLAPGVTIVSERDPGSTIDTAFPTARVGDAYFKGSGTSQAAAVVSGVVALMLQANPGLSPDQVKKVLTNRAMDYITYQSPAGSAGAGLVNAMGAVGGALVNLLGTAPRANRYLTPSTGTGSLEQSRGSLHIYADINQNGQPVQVSGEIDALGNAWSGNAWSGSAWSGNAWSSNAWSNYSWEGNAWSGNAWSGVAWSGNAWSGMGWDGNAWSGNAWNGNAWSGNAWSGNAWSGNAWSGNAWSGNAWSGNAWSNVAWSGNAWSGEVWG